MQDYTGPVMTAAELAEMAAQDAAEQARMDAAYAIGTGTSWADEPQCDDCDAVRAEVAAMGAAVNMDDVLTDEDGNIVCEACWERYASPLHMWQEGE